jgi:hypothetical protein
MPNAIRLITTGATSLILLVSGCSDPYNVTVVGELRGTTTVHIDGKLVSPYRVTDVPLVSSDNATIKSPYSLLTLSTDTFIATAKLEALNMEGFLFIQDDREPFVHATNELRLTDLRVVRR